MIDVIFSLIAFSSVGILSYIRYILFDIGISLVFTLITSKCSDKTFRIVGIIFIGIFAIFAIAELEFKAFLDTFYTFRAVGGGINAVFEFAGPFIKSIPAHYYLILLSLVEFIILSFVNSFEYKIGPFISIILFVGSFLICNVTIQLENNIVREAYYYRTDYDSIIQTLGTNHFFLNDLYYLPKDVEQELTIIEEEPIEEDIPQEEVVVEEVKEEKKVRRFDDSLWKETSEKETDENLKTIDNYLMSRDIDQCNEMTGIYEGKNFIYFMVEAFDYIAIDPELTPTLYKLYSQGRSYENHFTPIYACGTGDSEYVGMTGTYPLVSNCTLYDTELNNRQSLAGLFKNKGYTVRSFHNWTDEFYPRSKVHPNYGFEEYWDFDSLHITPLNGWLSDDELIHKALPHFIDEEHFFVLLVTSAMHYPYDYSTTLGDRYLSEIQKVHPDFPLEIQRYISKAMDLDKGLEYLLEQLQEKGLLENTVIGLYGDHAPKTISVETLINCTSLIDRSVLWGQFKQPFILYSYGDKSEMNSSYCGSLDNLPTIANMFDLDYDPRLYAGNDIYSGNTVVKFTNGNWISNLGIYRNGEFTTFSGNVSDSYVDRINSEITNIKKVNQAMIKANYYNYRDFVISHQISK